MKWKKGDTLIEVALAIGIFSLVAIVVVSVISASTSSAQSSLEVTLTREDLDSQAEALRFIHESYVSGSQSADTSKNIYANVWKKITDRAVSESTARTNGSLDYRPATCSELYDTSTKKLKNDNKVGSNPFVINIRRLNEYANPDNIIISGLSETGGSLSNSVVFRAPVTYPRLLYGASTTYTDEESLIAQAANNNLTLKAVEGIYVIAVRGEEKIVSGSGGSVSTKTAYYDFYIRSCWMPPSSDRASTISTVIRLYDPAVIAY